MFAAVRLHVLDVEIAAARLRPALATLGLVSSSPARWGALELVRATAHDARTSGLHVAFIAPVLAGVDAFWQAGVAAGLTDDGPPGPRPQYAADYHAAFLRDPAGNSFEAVHRAAAPRRGVLDHVTARVADLERATARLVQVAAATGLSLRAEAGGSALVAPAPGDALLLVPGPPTLGLDVSWRTAGAPIPLALGC